MFAAWVIAQRHHAHSPRPGLYVVLCFTVGLAFAFPLYLGRRERLLRRSRGATA